MWAFGSGVRKGSVHGEEAVCQDRAWVHASGERLVAIVADGAGSTELGQVGANIATQVMGAALAELSDVTREAIVEAFRGAVQAVNEEAVRLERPVSDLSSTLLGAVAGASEAFFFQIGDGAVAYRLGDDYAVAIWPEGGEFVNTTVFVTSPDAEKHFQVRRIAGSVQEVMVFSDGIQYLVLDHKVKVPHQKFFHSVSEQLAFEGEGRIAFFDQWIEALLGAPQVTSRTDDDTSLIVAKRVEGHVASL